MNRILKTYIIIILIILSLFGCQSKITNESFVENNSSIKETQFTFEMTPHEYISYNYLLNYDVNIESILDSWLASNPNPTLNEFSTYIAENISEFADSTLYSKVVKDAILEFSLDREPDLAFTDNYAQVYIDSDGSHGGLNLIEDFCKNDYSNYKQRHIDLAAKISPRMQYFVSQEHLYTLAPVIEFNVYLKWLDDELDASDLEPIEIEFLKFSKNNTLFCKWLYDNGYDNEGDAFRASVEDNIVTVWTWQYNRYYCPRLSCSGGVFYPGDPYNYNSHEDHLNDARANGSSSSRIVGWVTRLARWWSATGLGGHL